MIRPELMKRHSKDNKQPGLGLKPLKEDCFAQLLSCSSFLKRGEFGNVV